MSFYDVPRFLFSPINHGGAADGTNENIAIIITGTQ